MELSDPIYDFLTKEVQVTYKDACICWIEKIENKMLTERYENYKKSLKTPNEKLLYHGTSKDVVYKIAYDGFRPELNTTSAFGKGVYFSTRAEYSKDYSIMKSGATIYKSKCARTKAEDDIAYMLVSNVAVGISGQGVANQEIPKQYDSFTDNIRRPDMYIVNKKEACNPIYIVAFYPYAPK